MVEAETETGRIVEGSLGRRGKGMVCTDGGFNPAAGPRLAARFLRMGTGVFFADDFDYEPEGARAKFWKDEKISGLIAKLTDALCSSAGVEP